MKKTAENVRAIVESVVELEGPGLGLDMEPFIQSYLNGEPYTPANDAEDEIIAVVQEPLWIHFERYNPSAKQAWEDNAERIPVKIAGREFQTFMDEHGVQRFCGNAVIRRMLDSRVLSNSHGELSLNTLTIDFHTGMFSTEDWLDFMTSFGYSVSGLTGLSYFQHLPVENPLWEDE
jgi:DNA-directed RNA polymerase subunit N (RpoN/RPB10)